MSTMKWHRRGDHPVDTHILVHHSRHRPEWLEQTLASVEHEPTNILLVDSAETNVGALRAAALVEGTAPFVSFVDDDDFVHAGAFDACLRAIDARGIVGAYTDFRAIDAATESELYVTAKEAWSPLVQLTHPYLVLHLHVWRRAAMTPAMLAELAQWETLEEALLMGLLVAAGEWRKVDVVGYTKRQHQHGAGARITSELEQRMTRRLADVLLPRPATPQTKAAASPLASRTAVPARHIPCGFCRGVRRLLRIR